MSDSTDKSKSEDSLSLDLSQLQDLSFGPDWSDSARSAEARKSKPSRSGGGRKPQRDRRPDRPAKRFDGPRSDGPHGGGDERRRGGGQRGERRGGQRGERRTGPPQPFRPVVEVAFYPEDAPFKALCHAMRGNCRTYELFEIARLILEKPDRFVVVLHPKQNEGPQEFFLSVPDGLPFGSEDQAVAHVLKTHLSLFAETEEVEVEPPSGNFPSVNKCGVSGELLGPPNYHRYQAILQESHAIHAPNMPMEKYQARIESIRDEEVVQQWIEKMRKVTRYRLKGASEGDEGESFDTLESLKFYLVNNRRAEIVRTTNQARFSGKQLESLPSGQIRSSITGWREQQQHFPLDTANNLRGRLRRMHFTIYKRGSKGASYVCAVKRKFRTPQTRLAESLQELIDFIEKHPNINVGELPEQYLGIDVKSKPIAETPQEKAPDIEAVPEEEAAKIVEAHEQRRAEKAKAAAEGAESSEEPAPAAEATSTEEPAATEAPAEVSAAEPTSISEAETAAPVAEEAAKETAPVEAEQPKGATEGLDDPQLRQMMFDLRWLVTEGYVTEFGDGRLFAPAPMEEARSAKKPETPEPQPAAESPASPEAPAETPAPEAEAAAEAPGAETEAPAADANASDATATAEEPVAEEPKAELSEAPSEEPTRTST
ncbi:MAG: hypothetical protein AAFX93_17725 [Verrucomicrobiota bacterium]